MSDVKLSINPNESEAASILNVEIGAVIHNPYRDLTMFPIKQDKVDSLVESIQQTGFWPSIIARPIDNKIDGKVVTRQELEGLIAAGHDFSDVEWEQAFGHHRLAALESIDRTIIPIIPQILNDESMLLMMANENKEGFGSNINSQLETVRQVKISLEDSIEGLDDFEAYKSSGGSFFETAKQFKNAQSQGIGFKVVKKFLGETWSERDVRSPVLVLKAIDAGHLFQEDIVNVPTMGLLDGIAALATVLGEGHMPQGKDAVLVPAPDWPEFCKIQSLAKIITRCSITDKQSDIPVTVKMLGDARKALIKFGVNPAAYLATGKGENAFDVTAAMKKELLSKDATLEENMNSINEWLARYDVVGWTGLEELAVKLKKTATNMDKGEEEEEAPLDGEGGLDATTEGDVDAAINEANEQVEAGINAAFGDFGEVEGAGPTPINQAVNKVAIGCEILSGGIGGLIPRSGEFEADEAYTASVTTLLQDVATLAFLTVGKEALTKAFKSATTYVAPAEVPEEGTEEG